MKLRLALVVLLLASAGCGGRRSDRSDPTDRRDTTTTTPTGVDAAVEPAGETLDVAVSTPDGRTRSAHLYAPASLPEGPLPLLVAMHGGGGTGAQFEETSGYDGLAEANGFLVVYPDGIGFGRHEDRLRTWNAGVCCGAAVKDHLDDVGFMRLLVDKIQGQYDIDPDRVFATGHSNGMIMSYRLLCEAADVFVAAAGQAGTLGVERCSPSAPVSMLHLHGEADTSLPIDGGEGEGIAGVDFPSPRAGIRTLAAADGCSPEPTTEAADPVTTETWSGCDAATSIELVAVAGASHAWMGADAQPSRPGAPEPFAGYDASLNAWAFLAAHARQP